jgi:hypothetical protein
MDISLARGSGKRRRLFPTVVLPVFSLLFTLSKSLIPHDDCRYVVNSASLSSGSRASRAGAEAA